jgi:hypothetical protein
MLNITDTLNQLDLVCCNFILFCSPHMHSIHTTWLSLFVQSDSDFGEHVAKLINVLGCELCQIYAENALPAEAKSE